MTAYLIIRCGDNYNHKTIIFYTPPAFIREKVEEILKALGLTELEIKIFKFLLISGPHQAGDISRKTGIHRRNAYDALERLIQKGLVSFIKENNKRVYEASDPKVVQEKLKQRTDEWTTLIPTLQAHMSSWDEKKETLFFRGTAGIKHIFLDQISVGKEVLVFATSKDVKNVVKHFLPKYQLLRKEKNIPTRMLLDTSAKADHAQTIKSLPLCKAKFLDNFNASHSSQYIYGNNVAFVVWGEEPFAILIRHEDIASSLRERFELLWKS